MQTFFRRVGAYFIDILLVSFVVSLISSIPFLNPGRDQYSEKYNELVNVFERYQANEISMDEYNQAYRPIAYELYRLNISYIIIDLVVLVSYFGVFAYFFGGQTIGKKVLKIRVVSKYDSPLSLVRMIIRSIILSNALISILLLIIVYTYSQDNYYGVYEKVNLLGSILTYINVFLALVQKEGRGIHDLVAGTKVELIEINSKKVEQEQEILEYELEKPKKEESKTKSKQKKESTK